MLIITGIAVIATNKEVKMKPIFEIPYSQISELFHSYGRDCSWFNFSNGKLP